MEEFIYRHAYIPVYTDIYIFKYFFNKEKNKIKYSNNLSKITLEVPVQLDEPEFQI